MAGGTGSGVGSNLIQLIKSNFSSLNLICFLVAPL